MTSNPALHDAEHALYVVVGYLFFLPVLGGEPIRWRISYPARLFILFLTMPVDTFTGLVLGYSNSPVNSGEPAPSWAPNPISDLHSGGAVMWIGGDAIMFVIMMLVFLVWSRDGRISASGGGWLEAARRASFTGLTGADRPAATDTAAGAAAGAVATTAAAAAAPGARTMQRDDGTIDDDEHLAAYNEYLARINAAETRNRGR
jgi:putative copper resistance protein D